MCSESSKSETTALSSDVHPAKRSTFCPPCITKHLTTNDRPLPVESENTDNALFFTVNFISAVQFAVSHFLAGVPLFTYLIAERLSVRLITVQAQRVLVGS